MTDLAASYAALGLRLTGSERREIIVEHELLVTLDEDLVHFLHVKLGTEGDGGKGLGLTAGEYCRTVGARQIIDLAPDRTDLGSVTAVDAETLVKDQVAEGFPLLVAEITVDHHLLLLGFLFGKSERLYAFCLDAAKGSFANKAEKFTSWFMMIVPHIIPHILFDISLGIEGMIQCIIIMILYILVFGLLFAILQRKRDIASAMIVHGIVDFIRFVLFGVPGL